MSTTTNPHLADVTNDGRPVFHTLRWCNVVHRDFSFTLDPKAIFGESRAAKDPDAMHSHFDVRDLPAEFIPADNYQTLNNETWERLESPVKWAIKALEAGIDPLECTHAAMLAAAKGGAA